jgi:ammonia channel protein AmtB
MLWLLAIVFAGLSNAYFGWNWRPKSDAEMICDGIVFVLVAIAASKHL